MTHEPVVILGGGPAGLAAAHQLVKNGLRPVLFEKGDRVGGIARTESYKDYLFDLGGHRFFTKIDRIDRLWREMIGEDFLKVRRQSRIYYRGRFFNYPLSLANALTNLGIIESLLIPLSYLKAQVRPARVEETFEQWVANRFGRRLYETFFKTYTEKVWGIPCSEIRADWAAQRIKGLSLMAAVANALFGTQKSKTLIDEFDYPARGPGMMWERFQEAVVAGEGRVNLNAEATRLIHDSGRVKSVIVREGGGEREQPVNQLISSIPLARLVELLEPKAPVDVLEAARGFSYRAFLIVGLIVDRKDLFSDQWIYIHSPEVRVGRIQNFRNWSAAMVPDPERSNIGMEYFCSRDDEFWRKPDDELIEIATRELSRLGLAPAGSVLDGFVIRQPYAYPVYDQGYKERIEVVRRHLETYENLQTIGRNGMHRYNNMDHSMYTGILAADIVLGAEYDIWNVNEEEEYLEEVRKVEEPVPAKILIRTFARMDKLALSTAVGTASGLTFFLATLVLVLKGGEVVGPNLSLLNQYFVLYSVTVHGAFIAFVHAFVLGFLFGWLIAYFRNLCLALYVYRAKRKAEMLSLMDFFDHL